VGEVQSFYGFVIELLEGKKHPADGPSRRPHYEIRYKKPTTRLLATLAATTVELYDDHLPGIQTAQAIDTLAADVKHRILQTPIVNSPYLQRIDELEAESSNKWKVNAGVLPYKGRRYIPNNDLLRNKVICLYHNNAESCHFEALKTAELVSRNFH
jgi:hypothetical protein